MAGATTSFRYWEEELPWEHSTRATLQKLIAVCRVGRGPVVANTVAKVVNRTTPKISRKSIFRRLYLYNVPWRRYEGPWSFVCETMWSPHVGACETHQRP